MTTSFQLNSQLRGQAFSLFSFGEVVLAAKKQKAEDLDDEDMEEDDDLDNDFEDDFEDDDKDFFEESEFDDFDTYDEDEEEDFY